MYDQSGKAYIDFVSGICVSNLGHGVKEIIAAIRDQSEAYLHPMVFGEAIMSPMTKLAELLYQEIGDPLDNIYFTNSGAEAIEGALKLAKKFSGRKKIIAFENAYHGSTHGAMSVSGNPTFKEGYGPLLPEVYHLPYNDMEALERIDDSCAAVLIEPIQGAGGMILPIPSYLEKVREACDRTGALLIMDEIQTGIGRTGKLFAFQFENFKPDILVLAKALGGGLPMGAFISSEEKMKVLRKDPVLGHITTFGGGPLACAAGLALIKKLLNERIMDEIPMKEAFLKNRLQHKGIKEIRGKGMMFAVLFEHAEIAQKVMNKGIELGLITIGFLNIDHGLRICPPLNSSMEELTKGIDLLHQAIDEVL